MNIPRKQARCAIYTRKSTEHNLDLEFNSLDAQREACEAYIKSQAHEGWRLIPGQFDDGGISGASLNRPALQALLLEIQAGKIDIVVVYKVDRLTRSLTDFAKLVELFDNNGVSFVSITQAFNTTSSMGRLTLNVLLSFAQFEREVIGERVRDKIAASKRKGLWMGGPVPFGYANVNKKLVIVEEEAKTVRGIFEAYVKAGSVMALSEILDKEGIRTKEKTLSTGKTSGGKRFGVGQLAYLLKNRAYLGEVVHGSQVFPGDHAAILDRDLFEAVQAKLEAGAIHRKLRLKSSPSLLGGRIFDDRGNKMSPSHTNKRGVRYRYYVSHAVLQHRKDEAGSVTRAPAPEIEKLVLDKLRDHLGYGVKDAPSENGPTLIEQRIARVVVKSEVLEIHLLEIGEGENDRAGMAGEHADDRDARAAVLVLPWTPPAGMAIKGVLHEPAGPPATLPSETREALLTAIGKARSWADDLAHARVRSVNDIATRERRSERHIRLLMPLAFVSPEVVRAIIEGTAPPNLTVTSLAQRLSESWTGQASYLR